MNTRVLKIKHGRFAKIHYDGDKLMLYAVDRQTVGYTVNIMRHHENNCIAFTFKLNDDNTNYILQANESSLELVKSDPLNQLDQVDGNSPTVWFEKDGFSDHYKVRTTLKSQKYICIDEKTKGIFISDDENARAEVEVDDI